MTTINPDTMALFLFGAILSITAAAATLLFLLTITGHRDDGVHTRLVKRPEKEKP